MDLVWEREHNPRWDDEKAQMFAGLPVGLFPEFEAFPSGASAAPKATGVGAVLPGDWWRVLADGATAGFGWMDVTWGDAEVLLAVAPTRQRRGVGTFVFDRLDEEAARRGVRYLYNVIPAAHPEPDRLRSWLERRGFASTGEGNLFRRQVRAKG